MHNLLSFEVCLQAAAQACLAAMTPGHLWAVQEGLLRYASTDPASREIWGRRRTRRKRRCDYCGGEIVAGEHFFAAYTLHAPWHYTKELCTPCLVNILLSLPDLATLPPISGTHWDVGAGGPVNLGLSAEDQARDAGLHTQKKLQEQIARETLVLLVWSMSSVQVGKVLGISDVAVRKRCLALQIPKPGRGFWAKVADSHPVESLIPEEIKRILRQYGFTSQFSNWLEGCEWLHHPAPQQEVTQAVRKTVEAQTNATNPLDVYPERRNRALSQERELS